MKITVSLLESDSVIRQQIFQSLKQDLTNVMARSRISILDKIKIVLAQALKEEPEYSSLANGDLRLQFGIPDPTAVDQVVQKLAETVDIKMIPITISSLGLKGGFTLTALKSDDMGGVVSDSSAMVNDSARGYSLPWLEWLLYKGNEIIVRKFDVELGPNPNSRTGMAVMVGSNNNWRVPPAFVGTITNNWTTRAIDRIEKQVGDIIQKTIENNI
jgi:hypothetical protein